MVEKVGSYKVTRTYKDTYERAMYVKTNPDSLPQASLDQYAQGVKRTPLLSTDAIKRSIDATHADINMGRFFKGLITREIAGIYVWNITDDLKTDFTNAEVSLDRHMRRNIGTNPSLM